MRTRLARSSRSASSRWSRKGTSCTSTRPTASRAARGCRGSTRGARSRCPSRRTRPGSCYGRCGSTTASTATSTSWSTFTRRSSCPPPTGWSATWTSATACPCLRGTCGRSGGASTRSPSAQSGRALMRRAASPISSATPAPTCATATPQSGCARQPTHTCTAPSSAAFPGGSQSRTMSRSPSTRCSTAPSTACGDSACTQPTTSG